MNNPIIFTNNRSIEIDQIDNDHITIYSPTKIIKDAVIGWKTIIGSFCYIAGHIGMGCKLQSQVFVPQGVFISDDVFIGPHVVFGNVDRPRAWFKQKYLETHVGQGVTIGAGSVIRPGIRIGAYAFIGAGSIVTKDVPEYTKVFGNPAKIKGRVDKEGKQVN